MNSTIPLTERKSALLRGRLAKEIKRLGIDVIVHRKKFKSDGSNGFIPDGEETFGTKGILKNCSNSAKEFKVTDGGKSYQVTDTFSVLYEEGKTYKMYDWFFYSGVKYTVLQASDVGNQHIYWLLNVTAELQEVEGYGS
jgi:hypothetical protein